MLSSTFLPARLFILALLFVPFASSLAQPLGAHVDYSAGTVPLDVAVADVSLTVDLERVLEAVEVNADEARVGILRAVEDEGFGLGAALGSGVVESEMGDGEVVLDHHRPSAFLRMQHNSTTMTIQERAV